MDYAPDSLTHRPCHQPYPSPTHRLSTNDPPAAPMHLTPVNSTLAQKSEPDIFLKIEECKLLISCSL